MKIFMKLRLFLYLLISVWWFASCNENNISTKTPINPCDGSHPFTAGISISEHMFYGGSTSVLNDTVLGGNTITFVATGDSAAVYEWKIGNDPRTWTGNSVSLSFDNILGVIPVRLVAWGLPNTRCFAGDDGVDTVRKNLYIQNWRNANILGIYRGSDTDNPTDSFMIDLYFHVFQKTGDTVLILNNFTKGCQNPNVTSDGDSIAIIRVAHGYNSFGFICETEGYGCNNSNGKGMLQPNGEDLIVNYNVMIAPDYKPIPKIFKGRRVH